MIIWITIAAITVVVVAALLTPLFRRAGTALPRRERELAIYRDQLAELQRELSAGRMLPAEAKGAEVEIQRKMLAIATDAEQADQSAGPATVSAAKVAATIAVASLAPIGAFAVYLSMGSPGLPAFPFDPDRKSEPAVAEHGDSEIDKMVATLAERMKQDPSNIEGWVLLARSYSAVGRHAEAAQAYERVFALSNRDTAYAGDYGESLVLAAGGQVAPMALSLFEQVAERNPAEPRARYYLALGLAQSGKTRDAIAMWRGLEADSPPDAPWLPAVREVIDMVAEEAGIDASTVPPAASAPISAPSGPTAEDVADAEAMSPDDQQQMIQAMVARLAARLENEPNDVAGWLRLARSYAVLGERDKAAEALRRAAAVSGAPLELKGQVAAVAEELGIDLSSGDSAAAAPATTDGSDDQAAMIQAMVDGLAQRLQSSPNDLEGWKRLGRSYLVLNQPVRAQEAYARAVALAPTDIGVLKGYAQATMLAPGAIAVPRESLAILRKALATDGEDTTALWLVAIAESEAGNGPEAATLFQRLLQQLSPGSPAYEIVKARLDKTTPLP